MKHFFAQRAATVLMLDDLTTDVLDKSVHSIAHGVIHLDELAPEYGPDRRRLRVLKYRGSPFRGGFHDFVIETGGVRVFPRLVSAEHRRDFKRNLLKTGNTEFNALLGGGIERGSSVLVLGPAGAGKSVLALTFIATAIERGERVAMFVFDEEMGLLMNRAKGFGIDLAAMMKSGNLLLTQIDAAELTPGAFSWRVRDCIEQFGARTVVIDSLTGYQAAMPEERALILHMHEILQFCNRNGATTFLTVAQHGLLGDMKAPIDLTYLADTVILLRYFEALGEVRRAISIVKKRTSAHETTIREYRMHSGGFSLGEPLTHFHGVLRGVPTIVDRPRARSRRKK
jgi:circadian clock protein KaiC